MRRVIVLGSLLGFRPHPDDLMDSRFDGIKGGEKCNPPAKQVKAFFKKHGLEDRIEELVKWYEEDRNRDRRRHRARVFLGAPQGAVLRQNLGAPELFARDSGG